MKIIEQTTVRFRKVNRYIIELPSGKKVEVEKSWIDDEFETDCDYEIENEKILTEEEQNDLKDFIYELA